MGELIQSMDWTKTKLGPIESWPQSLCTTVSLCLASSFPISLAWGPHHVQIYNDGYWPICGEKHPHSLGQDFRECWASAWPVIGEAFSSALAGKTSFLENQRIFLDRNGYLEETFFTFSFSPIRDETGVAGLFHPVTETTGRMLSERRTGALRDLVAHTGKAQTMEEACVLAAQTLSGYQLDLPFLVFYMRSDHGEEARLIASSGLPQGSPASPALVNLRTASESTWPLADVACSGRAQLAENLKSSFGAFSCGEYPEPSKEAMVLPIKLPGGEIPIAFLVAGVSTRLPLNEAYRAFYDLLAAAVASEMANARTYEGERKRAEALAEIDRAKTAFFSNVSHEFRTPLTLILGPLENELAERENPLPPARRESLETAHRNSLRLLKLVNTLLDFSRIEAGREQASYEPTDLASYTEELASVFRSAVESAGMTLTLHCPSLPEQAYVDREMWEKIVLNLLSNAFKHTFEGGITVSLRWCGDHVELTVADTGVGIPAVELPRLFDRFHRVKGTKSRTHEGTGIGLALVRDLVSLHGGTVSVDSHEGSGSTFTITIRTRSAHLPSNRLGTPYALASTETRAAAYVAEALQWLPHPAASAPSGSGQQDASGKPAEAAAPLGLRRARVLLADDNADMREYVRRLLAGRYDVQAVADGSAALAAALKQSPDLVLTDIMMPGLDGFGLLRELRADARTRTIPVVLLSARAGEEAAVEGLNEGADDYLAKPFSAQELLARVRTHLELARVRREWVTELERSNKELESFCYSISHDLRAPLRAIDGFSEALLEEYAGKLDKQAWHYLQRTRAGAQKLSEIINDLLELSRVGRGGMAKRLVNLTEMAHSEVAALRRINPRRQVSIEIEDGLSACADPRLIRSVLANLLGNAWKFTAKQGDARIAFGRESGEEGAFYVRDNGAGFDMAYARRLFEPFQRMHRDSEFEGTGIGLASVQRIISRHGGLIWAEAAVDAGATFRFTLGGIQ